jgi:hypothetical protein
VGLDGIKVKPAMGASQLKKKMCENFPLSPS